MHDSYWANTLLLIFDKNFKAWHRSRFVSHKWAGDATQVFRKYILTSEKQKIQGSWTGTFLSLSLLHNSLSGSYSLHPLCGRPTCWPNKPAARSPLPFVLIMKSWLEQWLMTSHSFAYSFVTLWFLFSYLHLPRPVPPKHTVFFFFFNLYLCLLKESCKSLLMAFNRKFYFYYREA